MAQVDTEWEHVLKSSRPKHFSHCTVFDILSRLPVKSILRFKSVCKKWCSLFGGSEFIEAHLDRSKNGFLVRRYFYDKTVFSLRSEENFEELGELHFKPEHSSEYKIVASANGIVCIIKRDVIFSWSWPRRHLSVLLWNPATRELKILLKYLPRGLEYCMGFGFDKKNHDYKVVVPFRSEDSVIKLHIYSLRADNWTRAVEIDSSRHLYPTKVINVNGRMHWLVPSLSYRIVSFDISEEKIIKMVTPKIDAKYDVRPQLHESPASLGKSLILCIWEGFLGIQVWFMQEYGNSKSWTMLYYLPSQPHPKYGSNIIPYIFLGNGKIIVLKCRQNMHLYDPKGQVWEFLYNDDQGYSQMVNFKESLVSLLGGGSFGNLNHSGSISNVSLG